MSERIPITDDILFGTIMRKKEFCIPSLEVILNVKIRDITYIKETPRNTITKKKKGAMRKRRG